MKELLIRESGEIKFKDLKQLGGNFSTKEIINFKGIGSRRIIYKSGLEKVDALIHNVSGRICFLNFELLKKGIVARINVNHKTLAFGVSLNELNIIELIGYRVKVRKWKYFNIEREIKLRGELKIKSINGKEVFAIININDYDSIVEFFNRQNLVEYFQNSISMNKPEKGYSKFIEYWDILINGLSPDD